MKLLFDENISPYLVQRLADVYPDSTHVSLVGLDSTSDLTVWEYARTNGFVIVTKDADFSDDGLSRGFPPKILWLRLGNCTTRQIERSLRSSLATILALAAIQVTAF